MNNMGVTITKEAMLAAGMLPNCAGMLHHLERSVAQGRTDGSTYYAEWTPELAAELYDGNVERLGWIVLMERKGLLPRVEFEILPEHQNLRCLQYRPQP